MRKILLGSVLLGSLIVGVLLPTIITAQGIIPGEEKITECCRVKHDFSADPLPGDTTGPSKGMIVKPGPDAECPLTGPSKETSNWATYCTIDSIHTISDWIFWIVFVVAALIIVVAGLMFMTAGGNPDKLKKAQNILIYGIVGAIVAVVAKFLPAVARYFIGV